MKTIFLCEQGSADYERASAFAKRIYRDELSFILDDPPEIFVAIEDPDRSIRGAIGLNRQLTRSLFLNDRRVMEHLTTYDHGAIAEQSVLALERTELGLPILLATLASVAHHRKIPWIVFAGIDVSLRTLDRIGLSVNAICDADQATLRDDERSNYVKWFSLYTPIVCTIATAQARDVCIQLLERWKHRVRLSEELTRELEITEHLDREVVHR